MHSDKSKIVVKIQIMVAMLKKKIFCELFLQDAIGICTILIFQHPNVQKSLFCKLLILAHSCWVKINGEWKLMGLRYIVADSVLLSL